MDENPVRDLPVIVNREKSGSKPGQLIEPLSGGTAVCVQPRARSVARTETRLASAMSAGRQPLLLAARVLRGRDRGERTREGEHEEDDGGEAAGFGPSPGSSGLAASRNPRTGDIGRQRPARQVLLDDALRRAERPGVLDELAHLVGVERREADVHPVVAHVRLARQRELLRVGLDERGAPLLREREPHRLAFAREGEPDDAADPELDASADERLGAARQRAGERPDLVHRHHGSCHSPRWIERPCTWRILPTERRVTRLRTSRRWRPAARGTARRAARSPSPREERSPLRAQPRPSRGLRGRAAPRPGRPGARRAR